jgi:hypothetical protein
VACPFFDPLEPIDPPVTRVSLGQAYAGRCSLVTDPAAQPPRDTQLTLCNAGYARAACEHFPGEEKIDAIRFSADAAGILWIEESAHSPLRFGRGGDVGPLRARQAKAFLRSIEEGKVR